MRIRNGKIKLDPGEKRTGNFIVKDEREHMKLSDLGGLFTHRFSKRTPIGAFLKDAFDDMAGSDEGKKGIAAWISVLFTVCATVPDPQFMEGAFKCAEACMKRHPEAYGMPSSEGTDAENEQAAQEVKEMMEFEEKVKQMPDD